jgi:cation transport protein ChaC
MKRWPHPPDKLSRGDLENDRMRQTLRFDGRFDAHFLRPAALGIAQRDARGEARGAGWWVFAYGSLLWNPLFPVAEMRPAVVGGLHRRFCLWSLASRGTRECPGLVLGLDRGGACRGIAMRLPAPLAIDELHLLWRREMAVGSYHPRWVKVDTGGRGIVALAFVVKRDHPQYAGRLTLDIEADVLRNACGAFGSSLDYLERTRVALVAHGIVDPYLERLANEVAGRVPARMPK